jgi:cell division protein FtsA
MALKNLLPKLHKKEKIVAILDIGSSKIVCLIANIEDDKINIIGSGCQSANGFKNGNISDSNLAKESIIAAVDQAEKAASITIESIVLALNGNKIRSHHLVPSIILKNKKVATSDIDQLTNQSLKDLESSGHEVIHYFPTEYIIDDNYGIKDPCGLIGNVLKANIHFVTVPSALLENIINCLGSCQIDVEDCVFAPYAAGLATLSDGDKELGATIIDFGAGITSYAIFIEKNMVHCGFIPIGSSSITNDIAKSFMIDMATAERMKNIHGAASINYTDKQKMINYNSSDYEEKSILNAELNEIISARVDEIFKLLSRLFDKHYKLYPSAKNNIVLTGGGSMLIDITKQASNSFGSKVRLGTPLIATGLSNDIVNATYSAAIGVLQYITNLNMNKKLETSKNSSFLYKITTWLKKNF